MDNSKKNQNEEKSVCSEDFLSKKKTGVFSKKVNPRVKEMIEKVSKKSDEFNKRRR